MAKALQEAGVLFIPMPVANAAEAAARFEEAQAKLEEMALNADAGGDL